MRKKNAGILWQPKATSFLVSIDTRVSELWVQRIHTTSYCTDFYPHSSKFHVVPTLVTVDIQTVSSTQCASIFHTNFHMHGSTSSFVIAIRLKTNTRFSQPAYCCFIFYKMTVLTEVIYVWDLTFSQWCFWDFRPSGCHAVLLGKWFLIIQSVTVPSSSGSRIPLNIGSYTSWKSYISRHSNHNTTYWCTGHMSHHVAPTTTWHAVLLQCCTN